MDLFGKSGTVTALFLVALGVTIVILLRRSHRYLSRQKDSSVLVNTGRPVQQDRGHHLDAPPDVLRWEVEMQETARDLSAQLDSKMRALQALIREADRAAARLEAATADRWESTRPQPEQPPVNQAQALKSAGAKSAPGDAIPRPSAAERQEEIYTLSDYGYDAAEIAGRLGSPVGEVELILGLRGKK